MTTRWPPRAQLFRHGAGHHHSSVSSTCSRSKRLLDDNIKDLAKTITRECGKTLAEAEGELRRGIENVEVACGIPTMQMMGVNAEDISRGIDEFMIRQPVGVVAIITPFNFPGMISSGFSLYAIACGNCAILKPSEKTPVTMARVVELIEATKTAGRRGQSRPGRTRGG